MTILQRKFLPNIWDAKQTPLSLGHALAASYTTITPPLFFTLSPSTPGLMTPIHNGGQYRRMAEQHRYLPREY